MTIVNKQWQKKNHQQNSKMGKRNKQHMADMVLISLRGHLLCISESAGEYIAAVQPQYSRSIEGVERACEKIFYEYEVKNTSKKKKNRIKLNILCPFQIRV